MEQFIFWLAEWAGIDSESKSPLALVIALVVQVLFAVVMIGGGAIALVQHNGAMGVLIGVFLLVFGLGLTARIAINVRAARRKIDGTA